MIRFQCWRHSFETLPKVHKSLPPKTKQKKTQMNKDAVMRAPQPTHRPSISHTLTSDYCVVVKETKFSTQAAFGLFLESSFIGRIPNLKDSVRSEATKSLTEENLYHLGLVELGHRDAKKICSHKVSVCRKLS